MKGASLKVVQELMGHASIEMTMRYAHLSPNVSREAVRLLDSNGNMTATGNPVSCADENAGGEVLKLGE